MNPTVIYLGRPATPVKIILMMTVFLTAFSVMASPIPGTPEQDAFIADARDRFEKGRVPRIEELLNRTFYCTEREAGPSDFRQYSQSRLFFAAPGDGHVIALQKEDVSDRQTYTNTGKEWAMSMMGGNGYAMYESFRFDPQGSLIREYSTCLTQYKRDLYAKPLGKAADCAVVSTYATCKSIPARDECSGSNH